MTIRGDVIMNMDKACTYTLLAMTLLAGVFSIMVVKGMSEQFGHMEKTKQLASPATIAPASSSLP